MEKDYIHQLNMAYESFFGAHHQGAVVLPIDTDNLDYIRDPEALKFVENRIRQTLRLPPFQQELPLESQAER
jgi:deoxyadenosine/deoxycytidine kinase